MQKKNISYNGLYMFWKILFNLYLFYFIVMLIIYLWIYTFILALLWWLFIVAKIHAYKFKNFSQNIAKVTNFLLIFLIVLTLLGYITIIFSTWDTAKKSSYSTLDDVTY